MKLHLYSLLFLSLLFTQKVSAQIPRVKPPETPPPEAQTLPPLEYLLPSVETPQTPPSITEIPGEITVSKFNIEGSTIFSQEELNAILTGFIDRPISFAELLEAQETITQYYVSKGYISSGAFIPPQPLKDGVVTIKIIEGAIEEINITGLNRLNQNYLRSRIAKGAAAPFNQNTLLTSLQLLQLNPLIDKLNVELATGSRPGLSIINVTAKEADAFTTTFGFNNQNSPSVGTLTGEIELNHLNLTGNGDELMVNYSHSEGSDSLDNFRYTIPINPSNGTISFNHSRTNSNIIQEPFDKLNISSKYLGYELTYRQPIIETPEKEFVLGISGTREESRVKLNGEGYGGFSNSSNEKGETEISALRLFSEYLNRDKIQVLAIRSELSFGVDWLDATTYNDKPDSQFINWQTQGQYLRQITPDTLFVIKGSLQIANDVLPPLEQFSVGGQFSVRGYPQDAFLSDNGFFGSAEIRASILKIPEWKTLLQIAPFFDFATIWNDSKAASNPSTTTLSSVGLGLILNVGKDFQARLDYGIPLVDYSQTGNSLQENGIYFQLKYSPF